MLKYKLTIHYRVVRNIFLRIVLYDFGHMARFAKIWSRVHSPSRRSDEKDSEDAVGGVRKPLVERPMCDVLGFLCEHPKDRA